MVTDSAILVNKLIAFNGYIAYSCILDVRTVSNFIEKNSPSEADS